MEILNRSVNLNIFFKTVRSAEKKILLLDYDGTIAPFKKNRDEAVPYDGVEQILDEIMEFDECRVVIITGRWIKDLVKLINLKRRPEIWGSHGWERLMIDNKYHMDKIDENSIKALTYAEDWLREEGLESLCELKPASIALHWRDLEKDKVDEIIRKVMESWNLIPYNQELNLIGFDGGIEIRIPGKNKGDAVNAILSESHTEFAAAYIGDDVTDEDAFKALAKRGLKVLSRRKKRATCADIWIKPPEELLSFLNDWRIACQK